MTRAARRCAAVVALAACESTTPVAEGETGIETASMSVTGGASPGTESGGDTEGEGSEADDGSNDEPEPDLPPVVRADPPPPPISGGTLLLSADEAFAYVADPARDLVVVVDVGDPQQPVVVHEIPVASGAEPGRMVEDDQGLVHVVMRRGGTVVTVDPEVGEAVAEHEVCGNPRGVAFDVGDGSILVACAEGVLARVPAHGPVITRDVGRDLRDVVDVGPPVRVSTLRDAKVLTLDDDGVVVSEHGPQSLGFLDSRYVGPSSAPTEAPNQIALPNTARRTYLTEDGGWLMLHQAARARPVTVGNYYGGGCIPLQITVVSRWFPATDTVVSVPIENIAATFDMAATRDQTLTAMVGHDLDGPALAFIREEEVPEVIGLCLPWIHAAVPPAGTPTSVAIDSRGLLWVQTIEPAVLAAYDDVDRIGEVSLAASSVADTGHALLHAPSPVLLACVSCHPEGGDDGITWDVADQGLRRTQPLRGGLEGTAPFHWGGDLATMADLFHEVRHGRMRASDLSVDYADALQRYIFALPALAPPPTDPDAVEQGEVLFADAGCTTCHNGEQLTNNLTVPLPDYTPKQVPRLRGVALRTPYMHDGRAPDLASAVQEMTEMSSPSMEIGPTEIELLSEYLRSL